MHRKKGKRPLEPSDFVSDGTSGESVIRDKEKGRQALLAWAKQVNRRARKAEN